ncbi:hypothetical protein N7448_011273 [Penicillium atrosanguineum]|nr:hypothetical protein N7448_011273 [Penicillium atrosanguineum]
METNELSTTLKNVFDMTVFSHLLEMDEEEDRKISSTALYGFIGSGEEEADVMEYALSNQDFISLVSTSASLQQRAVAMGFYKVHESCENIGRAGAIMCQPGRDAKAIELVCLSFIEKEIGILNHYILYARRAIDFFYMT